MRNTMGGEAVLSRPRHTESWEAVELGSTLQKAMKMARKIAIKMFEFQRSASRSLRVF